MKIGIAMNPHSGAGRSEKYRKQLNAVLAKYPLETVWLEGDSAEESFALMQEASREVSCLVVVGGDGFIHAAVNAIGDTQIPLGIVAAGSGNDIAREFSLPIHSVTDSLHQILTSLLTKRFHEVDLIEISWAQGSERALAIVSVGIDAETNLRTNRMTWPKGNLRYVRALRSALADYRPYGVSVTMGGQTQSGLMTLLSVANTRYFGGGFCISPTASPSDGLLDVVLTPGLGKRDLAELLPKLILYRHTKDPRVHLYRTTEISVAPAYFGAPLPKVMADGEEICTAPATIKVLPKALKLAI